MFANIRYALRQLRQAPGFALTAVLTLALGIGASTALFAVLDAVLLRPLPFAQPDRLVAIRPVPYDVASIPTMQDYQEGAPALASVAGYASWNPEQKPVNGVSAQRVLKVSQRFFSTLGVQFAEGRSWAATGNEADCPAEAVVSGQFWHRLGGGALGRRMLNFDHRPFLIVGVLPMAQEIEGQPPLNRPEVFMSLGCDPGDNPKSRGDAAFEVLGRLRPGATAEALRAQLAIIDRREREQYPGNYVSYKAEFRRPPVVVPYVERLVGADTKPTLWIAFGACGLLLAIGCANLANLLLARATRRRDEFALRVTLGATLGQLLRQMLIENAILLTLGATCGLLLASGLIRLLQAATSLTLPRLQHASLRPGVVLFALAVSSAVAVLLTWLPARRTLRPELLRDLAGAGRSSAAGSLRLAGRALVVAQLTLTLVLVACSGWLAASVWVLLHQPLGFEPQNLLLVHVTFTGYHSKEDAVNAEEKIRQVGGFLRTLPGVKAVAATDHQPIGHSINRYTFCSDAHPDQCGHQVTLNPNSFAINPGYFGAIEQPLLQGRDFNAADDGRNPVAIVNQALAQREWPGQSPIGHHISTEEVQPDPGAPKGSRVWLTVVGVVGNVRNVALETAPEPDLYIPRSEDPSGYAIFAVRTVGPPELMHRTVEAVLRKRYPEASSRWAASMSEVMASDLADRSFLMQAAGAFAATALFLAILGTYGLLAYEVSLREKEIGIRLALGSSREAIVALLLRQEGRWLALGGASGLVCAAAAGYLLRARFYGAHSTSLPVLLGSTVLLLAPALAAVALPARHAAQQDPAQMLRRE